MTNIHRLFQLIVCVLLGAALSNCQRASYSFRPAPGNVGAQVAGPGAAPAVAGAPAAFFAAGSLRERPILTGRPRALRGRTARHRGHAATARRQPAPRANARPFRVAQPKARDNAPTPQEPAPVRYRSKGIALLLAVLLGGFGAHRFYLRYYGEGAAYLGLTALTGLFLTLGFLGLVFGSTSYSGFLVVAIVLSLLLQGWLIADIVRIITGNLKPKNGEYYRRFFQVSPDANTPPNSTTK